METKLLPCPFCGGEAHTRTNMAFDRLHKWTVECGTEDCMGFFGCAFFEHEAEAIEAWNTRYERTCETCSQIGNPDSFITHLLNSQCPHYDAVKHYCNVHSCEVCARKVWGDAD